MARVNQSAMQRASKKEGKISVIKPRKSIVNIPEKYKPSVYITNEQSQMVRKMELGQKISLSGVVTSVENSQKKGSRPTASVNIEIQKIKKDK